MLCCTYSNKKDENSTKSSNAVIGRDVLGKELVLLLKDTRQGRVQVKVYK